jgi:hypothetical protein
LAPEDCTAIFDFPPGLLAKATLKATALKGSLEIAKTVNLLQTNQISIGLP